MMDERIPPHDLEAERSLLGAMLLSRDAIVQAVDLLGSNDFYSQAHALIFSAVAAVYQRGEATDQTTVATELHNGDVLEAVGGKQVLLELMAETPASLHAREYANTVLRCSTMRRLIGVAGELAERVYDNSGEPTQLIRETHGLLDAADRTVVVEPARDLLDWSAQHHERRWVLPGLLERGDVFLLTGPEGIGKQTLLRQLGVMGACGMHPFTFEPIPAIRCLAVDCQDTQPQLAREMEWLRGSAGDRYRGGFNLESRQEGINLLGRDAQWLDALCAVHKPDLLVIGPQYAMFQVERGMSRNSDEAAEAVGGVLMRLRARHDFALAIEHHAPHGMGGDREGGRPKGSSFWMAWPGFGRWMDPQNEAGTVIKLKRFRKDREAGRPWPVNLQYGSVWPWETPEAQLADEEGMF